MLVNLVLLLMSLPLNADTGFHIEEDQVGFTLYENQVPVFYYHQRNNYLDQSRSRAHYFHPVFDLSGRSLTDDHPKDHLHHHGMWWAWSQMEVDGESVGHSWETHHFTWDVKQVKMDCSQLDLCQFKFHVDWLSTKRFGINRPERIVKEVSHLTIKPQQGGIRIFDVKISLQAYHTNTRIAGSKDDKGYGGFSFRMKTPNDMAFFGENGSITPQRTAVDQGPWLLVTGTFTDQGKSAISIIQHRSNPDFPQPWILRKREAMQNPAYPGNRWHEFDRGPLELHYRLMIHPSEGSRERTERQADLMNG